MVSSLQVENVAGSDCTGSDAAKNRTLTLSSSGTDNILITLIVENSALNSSDFSHNATTNVITFLNKIYDTDRIRVVYTTDGTVPVGSDYASVLDVRRILQTESAFSSSTAPTETEVLSFINEAEDQIDRETQHAWRAVTITEEYYDIPEIYVLTRNRHSQSGIPIYLKNRKIRTLDNSEGDKVEIWNGSSWEDWITAKTEGRANDFWVNYNDGTIYIKWVYPYFTEQSVRLTYRFGESTVPNDILQATALIAAALIVSSDDRSNLLAETGDPTRMTHDDRYGRWMARANKIIEDHKEVKTI